MNARNAEMTVIGAGSYGTALAITLARNGHQVVLWGHDPKHIATLQHDRCNAAFLPDVLFLIRLRWKAISLVLWRPAVTFSWLCQATCLALFYSRLNR
jgi:glycine/D-amino acid oxidase-like deaminating enzyme